ncbi:hypothetical protein J4406_00395 [Candidatus Woesearchaeota archaeon]|nr:hypothetical protein [Candidatus Woesearchaeota archaeon]
MKKGLIFSLMGLLLGAKAVKADFGGFNMMGGYYGGMWFFGTIIWILVVVALVLLIIWLIKQLQEPRRKK